MTSSPRDSAIEDVPSNGSSSSSSISSRGLFAGLFIGVEVKRGLVAALGSVDVQLSLQDTEAWTAALLKCGCNVLIDN